MGDIRNIPIQLVATPSAIAMNMTLQHLVATYKLIKEVL